MLQHACHTIVLSAWDWWEIVKLSGENMWEKEKEVEGEKTPGDEYLLWSIFYFGLD